MPKVKSSCSISLKNVMNEFGNDIFSTDGLVLYCEMYATKVESDCRFTIKQNLKLA
jgi:hypothetical protein